LLSFGAKSRLLVGYQKNIKIEAYRPILLPVVLYRQETWPLTLREEFKLRVVRK
jgi:hypothetical protein